MAISYDIEHKPTGGAVTLVTGVTGSPEVIAGLVAESGYEWRIRQVDTGANGAVIYSYWSTWDTFTTLAASVDLDITFASVSETSTVAAMAMGDITPPVITLIGGTLHRHILGEAYVDLGVTGTDETDGDISGSITFTDNIDINTIGKYQRTYDLVDAAGNHAVSVVRDIHVNVAETPLSYNLNYRQVGQGTTSITGLTGSPYEAIGLAKGTNHEFQVQAVGTYQNSEWSAWSGFLTTGAVGALDIVLGTVSETATVGTVSLSESGVLLFNTVTEASAVSSLTLTSPQNIQFNTVNSTEVVSALSVGIGGILATAWDLEFRNDTTLVVTSYPLLTQKTHEETGLSAASGYSFRVRGRADNNTLTGEWSEWFTFTTAAVATVVTPIYSQSLELEVFGIVIEGVSYLDGILTLSGTATQEVLTLFTIAGESFYKRVYTPTWSFTKTVPNTDLLAIDTLDELDEYDGASYYLLEGPDQVTGTDGILF